VKRATVLTFLIAAFMGGFFVAPAEGGMMTEGEFIQKTFLTPHNSRIDADMVLKMRDWYGIEPLWTLTILGAETSLADPKLGGRLVGANNFGCMRSGSASTKWGSLACGTITVAGKKWWVFPDPWTGMVAWGRLIKVGQDGFYLKKLQESDWRGFCEVYYGKGVPGFEKYLANVLKINASFKSKAFAAGFDW
jgi:hypothetical protein